MSCFCLYFQCFTCNIFLFSLTKLILKALIINKTHFLPTFYFFKYFYFNLLLSSVFSVDEPRFTSNRQYSSCRCLLSGTGSAKYSSENTTRRHSHTRDKNKVFRRHASSHQCPHVSTHVHFKFTKTQRTSPGYLFSFFKFNPFNFLFLKSVKWVQAQYLLAALFREGDWLRRKDVIFTTTIQTRQKSINI